MKVYNYGGGYDAYLDVQRRTTTRKRRRQWATRGDMEFVASALVDHGYQTTSGICHGTRSGREQRWLMESLVKLGEVPGMVIGSELHPDGVREADPLTFEHDFNKVRDDWVGRFSFVYSNSFDHAFDPAETLSVWAGQLRRGGVIILEHSRSHVRTSASDPTGGTIQDYHRLIKGCGLVRARTLRHQSHDNDKRKCYFLIHNPPEDETERAHEA